MYTQRVALLLAFILATLLFTISLYLSQPLSRAIAQVATATPTTSLLQTTTLTLTANADTYVQSNSATRNYGTANQLRVRSSGPTNNSYLRFVVSGIVGAVQSAKVRLYVTDASPSAGAIYAVSNNSLNTTTAWVETGMNWNNAPSIAGSALSTVGNAALNSWVEFDVTVAVKGNGTYSFGLRNSSIDPVYYSSKEANNNRPVLVLQVANATTATATSTPTVTATFTPVPPTVTATNTPIPPTNTATNTPIPATDTATNTPIPPTETATNTPAPPTETETNTPVLPTDTATDTPLPPTETATNTPDPLTETATNTPAPPTETVTNTPFLPTDTATETPVPPTNTATATPLSPTETVTNTPISPIDTATDTPVSPTDTATDTPIPPTDTTTETLVPPTDTATETPVPPTDTVTDTPIPSTATSTETLIAPTDTATETPVPPTDTATETPIPPTDTATNTPEATATPTFTPTATPIVLKTPYASAPLCPDHNPTIWHSLWNPILGCHYDHMHGVDPNSMANYVISGTTITYGPAGALYGGQTIGYSFETPNENMLKHRGYHVQAAIQLPCEQNNFAYINNPKPGCIRSFRIQIHNDHATVEAVTRFHSMYTEAELCTRAGVCGLWQGGGARNDTGEAHIPYKNTCVDVPGSNRPLCPTDPAEWSYILNIPPYWAFTRMEDARWNLENEYLCFDGMPYCWNQSSNRSVWELVSSDSPISSRYGEANFLVGMNWRTHAASSAYDATTGTFQYVCPNSDCVAIGDGVFLYTLIIRAPSFLDSDGNGMIEYFDGYTDPAGRVDMDHRCAAPSADCVPLRIQNVAVGNYIYDMNAPFLPDVRVWGDGVVTDGVRRFDITPPDVRCANDPSKRCSWVTLPENPQPHVH